MSAIYYLEVSEEDAADLAERPVRTPKEKP